MPTPTSWSDTTYVSLTYTQNIDALLWGTRWAGSTVTYSFPGGESSWSADIITGYGPSSGSREPWSTSFGILTASDQAYFTAALQKWANVSGLQFSLVADTSTNVGDIRAAYTPLSGAQAQAYLPGNSSAAGDVWFNINSTSAVDYWTPGSYANFAVLHELGHALGLKHPFEVGGLSSTILPSSWDSQSYTIMSYSAQAGDNTTNFSFYPTTPMILDIQAIQYVYGTNNNWHTGNDTYYYFDTTTYHETIWDAGGNDSIYYAGALGSTIDLHSGYGSDIGQNVYKQSALGVNLNAVNNVWIAYGVTIENAYGGSGNDTLIGNDANNALYGRSGNDTLYGGAGDDIFDGNSYNWAGSDTFYGGPGNDIYNLDTASDNVIEYSGEGVDEIVVNFSFNLDSLPYVENLTLLNGSLGTLFGLNLGLTPVSFTGNAGNNAIESGSGNDTIDGGAGKDWLTGYSGDDTLIGGAGNDTLNGGIGNDTLYGNTDNDTLYGNQDGDTLYGGQGTDTLYGGQGADVLYGNLADDVMYGNMADDFMYGGAGNDYLHGGADNDQLFGNLENDTFVGGMGNDSLTGGSGADTFVFSAGQGADTVMDFSALETDCLSIASGTNGITTAEQALACVYADASGNAVVDLGGGNSVTLFGVGVPWLHVSDFVIL